MLELKVIVFLRGKIDRSSINDNFKYSGIYAFYYMYTLQELAIMPYNGLAEKIVNMPQDWCKI